MKSQLEKIKTDLQKVIIQIEAILKPDDTDYLSREDPKWEKLCEWVKTKKPTATQVSNFLIEKGVKITAEDETYLEELRKR